MLSLIKKKEEYDNGYYYHLTVKDVIAGDHTIGDAIILQEEPLSLQGRIYEGNYALTRNILISEFESFGFKTLDLDFKLDPESNNHIYSFANSTIHFKQKSYENNSINIRLEFDLPNWNHLYSPSQFYISLSKEIELFSRPNTKRMYSISGDASGFNLVVKFSDKLISIDLLLVSIFFQFQLYYNQASRIFENKEERSTPSISNIFEFPIEIQSACEQYLIYFAQFLRDLGIEASTEIKRQAQHTLFNVIPQDSEEALDKIKEALDIYINLPQASDIELSQSENKDVSVQQLLSNIYHLKSQLMLANATIESKTATIQSLNISNYKLSEIVEAQSKELESEDELIGELVTVKKYDGKWFSINLPEIWRRLKRK